MRQLSPLVIGIRLGAGESSKKLLKFGCGTPQCEPIGKDLRVLEPNSQPLSDFAGDLAALAISPLAGGDGIEIGFQLSHGSAQIVRSGKSRDFFDQTVGGFDRVAGEIVRRKEVMLFTPARVRLQDFGVTEARAVVGEETCDRGGTRRRSEVFDKGLLNQIEIGSADNVFVDPLPRRDDERLSIHIYF